MKTLTLNLSGYVCKGVASVKHWGGGEACIEMKSFKVCQYSIISDDNLLLQNLNDAGFGVEKITGGIVDIYENYEGHLVFLESKEVGEIFDCCYYN